MGEKRGKEPSPATVTLVTLVGKHGAEPHRSALFRGGIALPPHLGRHRGRSGERRERRVQSEPRGPGESRSRVNGRQRSQRENNHLRRVTAEQASWRQEVSLRRGWPRCLRATHFRHAPKGRSYSSLVHKRELRGELLSARPQSLHFSGSAQAGELCGTEKEARRRPGEGELDDLGANQGRSWRLEEDDRRPGRRS